MKTFKEFRQGKGLKEVRYTNIYNQIKGIKGLKRKESDFIASIDPDVLGKVVNALAKRFPDMIESVDEAALVMPERHIIDSILSGIKDQIEKRIKRNKKDGLAFLDSLAQLAGYKITDKGQQKNYLYRYDIKK
tara:strand:+ start:90 stop:488 length:399 start_codon:yes stop_codon:yes gene_type:complete